MALELKEAGSEILDAYAAIPFTFRVDSALRVDEIDGGLGGLMLTEEPVDEPYVKDYDEDPAEGPARWPERFDVSTWPCYGTSASTPTIAAGASAPP